VNENVTITNAKMASGRLMLLGSESFFKIKIIARQKETIIKVKIDVELLKGITSSYGGMADMTL
jgi:hypothetical protein